jgi:hypothetical protein
LPLYFAMARGFQDSAAGLDIPAMEMTKWFDTNYHYIVPEFKPGQEFSLESNKPVEEFREAKSLGISTRPVLLGPVSFLLLGKMEGGRSTAQLKLLSPKPCLTSLYLDAGTPQFGHRGRTAPLIKRDQHETAPRAQLQFSRE